MAGVVRIPWYATLFRGDTFAEAVAELSPHAFRYGATRYAVHRSRDDKYKIDQMLWFESKDDWYRFWESAEVIEFRARWMGKYQVPVVYVWHDEIAAGELGPPISAETTQPEPELGGPGTDGGLGMDGGGPGADGGGPALPNGGRPAPAPTAP
jgi:hypothetical protein